MNVHKRICQILLRKLREKVQPFHKNTINKQKLTLLLIHKKLKYVFLLNIGISKQNIRKFTYCFSIMFYLENVMIS